MPRGDSQQGSWRSRIALQVVDASVAAAAVGAAAAAAVLSS